MLRYGQSTNTQKTKQNNTYQPRPTKTGSFVTDKTALLLLLFKLVAFL